MPKAVTRVTLDSKEIIDAVREVAKKHAGINGLGSGATTFFGIPKAETKTTIEVELDYVVVEFQGAPKDK